MKKWSIVLCVAVFAGHALAQNPETKSQKKDEASTEEVYVDEVKAQQSAIQREKASTEPGTHMNPGQLDAKESDQRQEEHKKKGR